MLFDLRGRHRRRAVKVIYIGLALLIGGGLVLFGVGTGGGSGGGGLLNAASENEGSGGASFADQIKKYEKTIKKQPTNVAAWEKLTAAELHESGGEAYVNPATGLPTSKGKELFARASRSWESYLALNPPKPSTELAKLMLRVYGPEGLNQPSAAVQVLQLVVAAEPKNASYYAQLAEFAYKAKNTRVGDLASTKAVALAPSAQRARVKTELEAVKKHPEGAETLTATTNGTVYTGKPNGKGGIEATAVGPAPKTTTTATTKSK
ncbi:MAG: tetratricopeptide repeat protein [Solirubrobacteraceae bacterium]